MEPQLLIVILNYLATDVTVDCLHSLSVCPVVLSGRAKVVIWENGTGADAVDTLREVLEENQWHHWAELLVSPENLGFTGGNNRVIERAQQNGDLPAYVLLLNSDTLVTDDALTSLIDFMDRHPQAGIAGSKLLTETGEHQCSPFRFPGIASEFDQGLKLGVVSRLLSDWCVAMQPPEEETPVDWVSGASMILRSNMLDQIGLLDESFFTYFEDMDLCQRAHQAGWQVWYVPQSRVVHLEGASSGIGHRIVIRRPTFWFQARRRYFLKNEGALKTLVIDAAFMVGFALWRVRRFMQKKPDFDPPGMLFDFIKQSSIIQGTEIRPVTNPSSMDQKKSMHQFVIEHFLVLPVPFRRQGDVLLIEAQAHHGLHRWLDNFETLALAAAVIPEYLAIERREVQWIQPDPVILERVKLVPLPWAYRPDQFLRAMLDTVRVLDPLIRDSRYLQFAISGLWGDWASVAAEIAIQQKRIYAVHTDNVCHEYILRATSNLGPMQRWRARIDSPLMKIWHKRLISQCNLGLFHGMDTYETYKIWMSADKCAASVHNIHDIPDQDADSSANISTSDQIHILYAGRVASEKAPLEWLSALQTVQSQGVKFRATWAGDGPLFNELQQAIQLSQLAEIISLPGFIASRADIATLLKSADLFVFTHVTPESPRCLIEALRLGVPIIGYDSAYARDLIEKNAGGVLVPRHNWQLLAEKVSQLVSNPELIAQLKVRALKDGERFTSRAVFLERSELIKSNL
ncbi:glycosyltransferase [Methylomonas lenta]|uniref:glycosyltransferase n=1 Tax=Methylomonas lenta TaxID=980561 RepID=UPI0009FE37BB|nr:glycosyltransferase [Methylomonas lenta]